MAQTRSIKKALSYAVPVTVAGAAAVTVGLVPALANSAGDPDLPEVTAEELVAKIAASETEQLSGTVRISTDLGLPGLAGQAMGGGPRGGSGAEDGSDADPRAKLMELASGTHTLRVAVDGPDRQRISVVEKAAEYSIVHNGRDVWAYDSAANAVHHTVLPEKSPHGDGESGADEDGKRAGDASGLDGITPQQAAREALKAVDGTTSVTVDGTAKVAGQDAYRLLIKPRASESTVGSVRIAVDADTGVPLKFTLTPKSGGKAVFDVGFADVDFAKPDADTFDFKPPKGAEVTEERLDGARGGAGAERRGEPRPEHREGKHGEEGRGLPSGLDLIGEGWGTVVRAELPGDGPRAGTGGADSAEAGELLDRFTDEVKGDFGTGRIFSTRLVNVLITDDGTVYAGAVTRDGLVRAAETAGPAD
ncbi:DUF2092 domain-containing protein [Streptomyces carminius]|uniref:DUF2092 domain-containing protein n=1 Tax=Streptomyces carminius TaxID=2665496 RepID=A0A2M8LU87_9ACTN|nr:DUF2092 domain-containing protein [Streptomyces carminius]PJE95525.1 DUF2092 domain-containing protein [Streptomyces carminius]